jgi:hypothetical protein
MIKLAALTFAALLTLAACDHTHGALPDAGPAEPGADGLTLHTAPPWKPPVEQADGSASECDGSTSSQPPGPARWTLTGEVSQVTPCAGGVLAAEVHVAISSQCGDWSANTLVQSQVVSLAAIKPRYVFQVPDGTHHLIAFADCSGGANAAAPSPQLGDVQYVTTNPGVQLCRTYKIKGQGFLDLPIKLDALVK